MLRLVAGFKALFSGGLRCNVLSCRLKLACWLSMRLGGYWWLHVNKGLRRFLRTDLQKFDKGFQGFGVVDKSALLLEAYIAPGHCTANPRQKKDLPA